LHILHKEWNRQNRQHGGVRMTSASMVKVEWEHAVTMAEAMCFPTQSEASSEQAAKLAQKLGQLQPFLAVFPQKCMGQLASSGPT
jgi:hypothetical protein